MKISTFTPYAKVSQESGLVALFSGYLRSSGHESTAIVCDGVFSACGRDSENGWNRALDSCFNCIREQNVLASWAGSSVHPLSQEIESSEYFELRKMIDKLTPTEFQNLTLARTNIWELCVDSLRDRLGAEVLHLADQRVQSTVRSVLLSSGILLRALTRLLKSKTDQMILISGERDALSRTALSVCKEYQVPCANFIWNVSKRCIEVRRSVDQSVLESPLVIDDIASFRNDPGTWSEDVISLLSELAHFLNLASYQEFLKAAP